MCQITARSTVCWCHVFAAWRLNSLQPVWQVGSGAGVGKMTSWQVGPRCARWKIFVEHVPWRTSRWFIVERNGLSNGARPWDEPDRLGPLEVVEQNSQTWAKMNSATILRGKDFAMANPMTIMHRTIPPRQNPRQFYARRYGQAGCMAWDEICDKNLWR
jgi:hypothetical protein